MNRNIKVNEQGAAINRREALTAMAGLTFSFAFSTEAIGPALAQVFFDGGLRKAQKAEAVAAWDGTVAGYRQTVLTAFQEVEDNLQSLTVLEQEAAVQDDAVKAARESATIASNQYRAGTTSYLTVVVLQAAALNNERTALGILGRRLAGSVNLIKAMGGGWNAAALAEK